MPATGFMMKPTVFIGIVCLDVTWVNLCIMVVLLIYKTKEAKKVMEVAV